MTTDNDSFIYHLKRIFEIAQQRGIDNPLDKSKWREMLVSDSLGHELFTKASGGKNSEKTYGADARNKSNERKGEYKTVEMSKRQAKNFTNGGRSASFSMIYNGAYCDENIDRYVDIDHYIALFIKERLVCIVIVPTDYVIETLRNNLNKKLLAEQTDGKRRTTNLSKVTIKFINNVPTIGQVLYNG